MLLAKALEKHINRGLDPINEDIDKAIDKAIKNAIGNRLGNAVESAVEDGIGSFFKSIVESTVESAVEDDVESAVEKAMEKAVEDAVEKAVEKSMAKHLDRSQELVSSQLTEQQDVSQSAPETDVVSEIPETQQDSMKIETTVAESIIEATDHKHDDDSEREEAALDDLFASEPDYTRHSPWPEDTFVIDMFNNFKLLLAVNKDMQPALLPRESARGHQLKLCLWECIEADDGWLHIRNPLTQKFLGLDASQSNGENQFPLCFSDNMNKETRFCLRSGMQIGTHLLQVPFANELHSMEPMLVGVHHQDDLIDGEIQFILSERFEKAIHIVRCSQDLKNEVL